MQKFFIWAKFLVKKAWTVIVVVSVVFGFYAYFHEKVPNVKFTVVGDPNVFDVYKSVSDLEIFFREKNIEKENLNLKIYTIKVENNGESDVLKASYDDGLPWGFSVVNGEIVSEVRVVGGNSDYLNSSINPKIVDGKVEFDRVIFEHGKYFVLEFLVLHSKAERPSLNTFGKIAGIDKFLVFRELQPAQGSIWKQLLGDGGFVIHIARLILYTFVFIVLLVGVIFSVDFYSKVKTKIQENKRDKRFKEYLAREPILNQDLVLFLNNLYVKNDVTGLKKFRNELKDEAGLIASIEAFKKVEYTKDPFKENYFIVSGDYLIHSYFNKDLLKALIINDGKTKKMDPSLKVELNKIIPYMNKLK